VGTVVGVHTASMGNWMVVWGTECTSIPGYPHPPTHLPLRLGVLSTGLQKHTLTCDNFRGIVAVLP